MPLVNVPAQLRRYADARVEVEATTVAGALDALCARFPELRERVFDDAGRLRSHLMLFRNKERVTDPEAALGPDDELDLVGAAAGG